MPYRKHWTSFASLTARQVGPMKIRPFCRNAGEAPALERATLKPSRGSARR